MKRQGHVTSEPEPEESPEHPNPGPGPALPPDEDPPLPTAPDLPPERVVFR